MNHCSTMAVSAAGYKEWLRGITRQKEKQPTCLNLISTRATYCFRFIRGGHDEISSSCYIGNKTQTRQWFAGLLQMPNTNGCFILITVW